MTLIGAMKGDKQISYMTLIEVHCHSTIHLRATVCSYVNLLNFHACMLLSAEIWNPCTLPGTGSVSSRSASLRPLFRLAPDAWATALPAWFNAHASWTHTHYNVLHTCRSCNNLSMVLRSGWHAEKLYFMLQVIILHVVMYLTQYYFKPRLLKPLTKYSSGYCLLQAVYWILLS